MAIDGKILDKAIELIYDDWEKEIIVFGKQLGRKKAMATEIEQELRRFAETTTIKGVSRTVRAERKIVRVFWILALVSCFMVLLYQMSAVVISYSKYNVIRNSGVDLREPEFPDVTVCSLFPLSDLDQLENYDAYLRDIETMKKYSRDGYETIPNLWEYLSSIAVYNTYIAQLAEPPKSAQNIIDHCYLYAWNSYDRIFCTDHFQLVAPLQWRQTIRNEFGSFSPAAISLMLFINAHRTNIIDNFYPWIRFPHTTGVRVMVHPKGSIPNPLTAIVVSPGTDTNIVLKQTDSTHLPYPYGNCTEHQNLDPPSPDSPAYNVDSCLSVCRQRQVIKDCGCLDP